jgi:DNA-binding beta-propeller fold protein YncE
MKKSVAFCLFGCIALSAQSPPAPTALSGQPFFIKKTWFIGGVGDWGSLALDPVASQLFIAHGPQVQVVDISTGTLAGTVSGFREAHSIALSPAGDFGYVTDGPAGMVQVFDRHSFQIVASIPTGPTPRSVVLENESKLLFVVGAISERAPEAADATHPAPRSSGSRPAGTSNSGTANKETALTIIDAESKKQLAQITVDGSLGSAETAGDGQVFITVTDRNQILRLNAQAISSALSQMADNGGRSRPANATRPQNKPLMLDWTSGAVPAPPADALPHRFRLGSDCQQPRALAIDGRHERLFAACTNMKMLVLDSGTGNLVTSLPIGQGADAIGYDPNRGMIFSADGGGDGSLTIIRQDVTDSYSVVQVLPTRHQARTLAINSSEGEVYLVTVLFGATMAGTPANNMGTIKMNAVDGSFQVLVIGN